MITDNTTSTELELIRAQTLARQAQFAMSVSKIVKWISPFFIASMIVAWWLFSQQYIQLLGIAGFLLLPTVGAWAYPLFKRRGQAQPGAIILIFAILLDIAADFILLPEAKIGLTIIYVFIIILAYLLLDDKDARWLTGVSVLIFSVDIVLVDLWHLDWLVSLDEAAALIIGASVGVSTLLIVTLTIRYIMLGQEDYFRQSQRANMEIERRAVSEQEQREHLQTTVQEYVAYMTGVGQGKLATRLTFEGNGHGSDDDPLLELGQQLNQTTENLHGMILGIREAANNLGSAAAEILAAATQQVAGANEQSASISQTTATVEEVKTISEQSTDRAQAVMDTSQHTVEISRTGRQAIEDTIASMTQIKDRVESIAENILALSEQTQQIGEIITTVNDIATQSNMLALNASVEAARASEHGKGFAVVAGEVRSLAEQSQQATAQVRSILLSIQNGINATVMATEEGIKVVDGGVASVTQAQRVIEQLAGVIDESAKTSMQMIAGGRQQTTGVDQIAIAMQNINQVTVQSLASTRQAERAAQDLNNLAQSLTGIVEQYQL
jgi:methyl-accepting chemotaxis protein